MENDMESYYMDIQQQVYEIYPSCITDSHKIEERERLQEILRLSKLFCQKHPKYLRLSLCIQRLAQNWDEDENFKKNLIKQRHSFIIINRLAITHIYDLSENDGIVSLLYDHTTDSDNRIIVIVINDNLSVYQNLYGILHEVGHYIGCRQRSKNNQIDRVQYFIELSLQAFLREVFFYACSELLKQPVRDYSVLNNPSYSCEKQRIMLGIITCLSDNSLYHWIYRQLADRVTQLRNEYAALALYRYAYSRKVIIVIHKAFCEIFNKYGDELHNRLCAVANTYSLDPDMTRRMMEALDYVSCNKIEAFLDDVSKILEEVAADVFMVRILDVRDRYLDYMLNSFNNEYANSKNTHIYELLDNTVERTRLSCIQAACMHRWPRHASKGIHYRLQNVCMRWWISRTCLTYLKCALAWLYKQYVLFFNEEEIYQVKKKIISISEKQNETMYLTPQVYYVSYRSAQRVYSLRGDWVTDCVQTSQDDDNRVNRANRLRILNPSVTLGEYVRAIMNDSRYDSFLQKKENTDTVKCLRSFRRAPRCQNHIK